MLSNPRQGVHMGLKSLNPFCFQSLYTIANQPTSLSPLKSIPSNRHVCKSECPPILCFLFSPTSQAWTCEDFSFVATLIFAEICPFPPPIFLSFGSFSVIDIPASSAPKTPRLCAFVHPPAEPLCFTLFHFLLAGSSFAQRFPLSAGFYWDAAIVKLLEKHGRPFVKTPSTIPLCPQSPDFFRIFLHLKYRHLALSQ